MVTKISASHDVIVQRRIHGAELLLPLSHALPRIVADHPFYDSALPNFASFLRGTSSEKITIVDVGANVGDTAKLIAAATGADQVRFMCIEADESYLSLLRRNTAGLDVSIHNVIAGATTEEAHATLLRTGRGTSSISIGEEARPVVSLDDLVGNASVDLIKIDTDGYEAEVLRGAARLLTQGSAPCFIELSPWHIKTYGKVAPAEITNLLRSAGYTSAILYDNVGIPLGLFDLGDNAIHNIIDYCLVKQNFYLDILVAKDRELLVRFHDLDMRRYPEVNWEAH